MPEPRNTSAPKSDVVQFAVTMPPALKERLNAAADERMISASVLARKAIEDFLDRLVPVEDLVLVTPAPMGQREAYGPPSTPAPSAPAGG